MLHCIDGPFFPVSTASYVFDNITVCEYSVSANDNVETSAVLDTKLTDSDHLSCIEVNGLTAVPITVRVSRQGGIFTMPTEVLVYGKHLDCSPGGGLTVFASALCRSAPCGALSLCTRLHTLPETACRFRCCEQNQACETFFLHLALNAAHQKMLCEVTIKN